MFYVRIIFAHYLQYTQWIILNWKGAKKYWSYRRCCSKMPIIFGITFWFKIVSHSAMGKKSMHYTWHYIVTKDLIDSKPWSVTLNYQTDDESATFKKTISHLIYWLKYFLPISLLLFSFNLCSSKCLSSRSAWVHTFQMPSR